MAKRTEIPKGKDKITIERGIQLTRRQPRRYLAACTGPDGKRTAQAFRTLEEARAWRLKGLTDPESLQGGKVTLREYWKQFCETERKDFEETTRRAWDSVWRNHIDPRLGGYPLRKITPRVVKDHLAALHEAGVGAPTRSKCRMILHRVFQAAIEDDEVLNNPLRVKGAKLKRHQVKKARITTPAELARILSAARVRFGEPTAVAIELMYMLGLRIGEMAGLQAWDIDLGAREITIRRTVNPFGTVRVNECADDESTKTDEFRVVPVPSDLPVWEHLVKHLRSSGSIGQTYVFSAPRGGVLLPNNWRKRVWRPIMQIAAIEDPPTPHTARRTTASLLSSAGVPPFVIQQILGHATLDQSYQYITASREDLEDGLRRLATVYDSGKWSDPSELG